MLQKITIENFALYERAQCEFTAGLNVISGETGAGKSILMEALNAVLGGKVSADYIRSGCKYFVVEAVFDNIPSSVAVLCAQYAIRCDGTLCIMRRYAQGRSEQTVNGVRLTLAQLKELAQYLVDVHGQHEHQALLRESTHLRLLDSFEPAITEKLVNYRAHYKHYRDISKKLDELHARASTAAQRQDILNWQIKEIAEANLKVGEDEELEHKGKVLANAEKIALAANNCHEAIEGSGRGQGALSGIGRAGEALEVLTRYYPQLIDYQQQLKQVELILADIAEIARDTVDNIEYSPQALDACYTRLEAIKKLRRKYGETVRDILQYQDDAKRELDEIENFDAHVDTLKAEITAVNKLLEQLADELSVARAVAADKLARELTIGLAQLAMQGGRLQAEITRNSELSESGWDSVEIMFSANTGEPVKPLVRVASGGELSRIALAVRASINQNEDVATVVFDEVDAGVGGKTAFAVARKLRAIARSRQVLCISHLAQIAAAAHSQFLLEKTTINDRTASNVRRVDDCERRRELARMLAGCINEKSLAMADELLKEGVL